MGKFFPKDNHAISGYKWTDFDANPKMNTISNSARGPGTYIYGVNDTQRVLDNHGIQCIISGHQDTRLLNIMGKQGCNTFLPVKDPEVDYQLFTISPLKIKNYIFPLDEMLVLTLSSAVVSKEIPFDAYGVLLIHKNEVHVRVLSKGTTKISDTFFFKKYLMTKKDYLQSKTIK